MEIRIEQVQGKVPVTVIRIEGNLDGTNYNELSQAADGAYQDGTRDLLLDMNELEFMSSAGIVAIQKIHNRFNTKGESAPAADTGWEAIQSLSSDKLWSKTPKHFKLLCPQGRVARALRIAGLDQYFEIFTDRDEAVASFG